MRISTRLMTALGVGRGKAAWNSNGRPFLCSTLYHIVIQPICYSIHLRDEPMARTDEQDEETGAVIAFRVSKKVRDEAEAVAATEGITCGAVARRALLRDLRGSDMKAPEVRR